MPTHADKRLSPYKASQIYDLVADVTAYPQFLPWCAAVRVLSRTEEANKTEMVADMVVAFKMFRERFSSRVTLDPALMRIDTQYDQGPFKYLHSWWCFRPLPAPEQGCEIEFYVDFELKNKILQKVMGVVFHHQMQRMTQAFEDRANLLYG